MLNIDLNTARRYVMGRQGLWPGRRWRGAEGTVQAMRAVEYLQLDPLQMIARSQDIQLHSRVLDYYPGMWEQAAYERRQFFDWGGWLAVRPIEELPYWRVVMRRQRQGDGRMLALARDHADAIEEMRLILRQRDTVSNRDFKMAERTRTNSYRGRKDSALALYYLWRTGEVMTHHRENFERVYALSEAVAPAHLLEESSEAEADRFMVLKEVRHEGLSRVSRTQEAYHRGVPFDRGGVSQVIKDLMEAGEIIPVQVEGWKQVYAAVASDAALIEALAAGQTPAEWTPLEVSTEEEAVFLSPLDPVSARGRAKVLFGFDYVWEVYKPEHKRTYGYYVLPVLWGDRLVARFDSKLDRATGAYRILGLWLEDPALGEDPAFAQALGRGFRRFAAFLGAQSVDTGGISAPLLRQAVDKSVDNPA